MKVFHYLSCCCFILSKAKPPALHHQLLLSSLYLSYQYWTDMGSLNKSSPAFPPRTDAPNPSSPWQPFAGLSPVSPSLSNIGEPSTFPKSSPEILHSPGTHCTPIPLLPSAQPGTQNIFALLSVLSTVFSAFFYQFNFEFNKVELTQQGEAKERSACPSLPNQTNPSTKSEMNLEKLTAHLT